jgi:hypothetical protein
MIASPRGIPRARRSNNNSTHLPLARARAAALAARARAIFCFSLWAALDLKTIPLSQ